MPTDDTNTSPAPDKGRSSEAEDFPRPATGGETPHPPHGTEPTSPGSAGKRLLFPEVAAKHPEAAARKRLFAVAAGKGGVGKSFITASLAASFARWGHRTLAVDADLGCPNLHTWLGLRRTTGGLGSFLKKRAATLEEAAMETSVPNLSLVSGARDMLSAPHITHFEKQRLLAHLKKIPSSYVFVDLSAGASYNTLDIFLAADAGIVVSTPEPTAVENLYRFLRAAALRRLFAVSKAKDVVTVLNAAEMMYGEGKMLSPMEIVEEAGRRAPEERAALAEAIENLDFRLIVNQVRRGEERELGEQIATLVRLHLGLKMEYLGAVEQDDDVRECLLQGKVLAADFAASAAARSVQRVADKFFKSL